MKKRKSTSLTLRQILTADYTSLSPEQKKTRDRIFFISDFITDGIEQYDIEKKIGKMHIPRDEPLTRDFNLLRCPVYLRILDKKREVKIYSTSEGYRTQSTNTADIGNKMYAVWWRYLSDKISWKDFSSQFDSSRSADNIQKNTNRYEEIGTKANDELCNFLYPTAKNDGGNIQNYKPPDSLNIMNELPGIIRILRRHGIIKPWLGTAAPPYVLNTSGHEIYDLWQRFFKGEYTWESFAGNFIFKTSPQNIYKNFSKRKNRLTDVILHEIKKYLTS